MYDDATVAVVVPAYNEEGYVGDVIETVPRFVDRMYVVEDGSTDGTWEEIQTAASCVNEQARRADGRYPAIVDRRVVPIRHGENRGVGGAIKTGYLAARRDEFDVTAVMGADGQMPPERLAAIVAPVAEGRADYAKGNRLLERDHHEAMPPFRYVGNQILTWLTKIASGYWTIGDPQNGFTAISLDALHAIDLEEMYEYYGYCNDLLVRLNVAGMQVVDVPSPTVYGDEESHIDYTEYVPRVSTMLARNFLRRIRAKYLDGIPHPIALLYAGAALAGLAGVGAAVATGTLSSLGGGLILGLTFLLTAMVWDRSRGRPLDGRISADSVPEPGTTPNPEPTPTD